MSAGTLMEPRALTIRGLVEHPRERYEAVLRSLLEWFAHEESLLEYAEKAELWPTFAAYCGDDLAGFLTIKDHFPGSAEVYCIAVHRDWRRQGVGPRLLAAAEKWLRNRGVRLLQVKTLSESRPDPYYAETRRFYVQNGFLPLEELPTLWHPAIPCLLLVKPLTSST